MTRRNLKFNLIVPIALLLVMLLIYAGTYYLMVRPEMKKFQNWAGASLIYFAPHYPDSDEFGNGVSAKVFAPMHWVDRRLRPRTWQGQVPTPEEWKEFFEYRLPISIPKSPSQTWTPEAPNEVPPELNPE